MMNGQGKSDRPEVPGKSPNNAGQPGAEGMEGRGLAKGNLLEPNASRTPSRPDAPSALEFGPCAVASRKRRGEGKPETFNFLGFTHICGKKRSGRFTVVRQTMRKRLQAKLSEVKTELRRRLHHSLPEVGQWLRSVVSGHYRYYGVPMNKPALHIFRFQTGWLWHRVLSRRSQKGRLPWDRMRRLIHRWLPPVRIYHEYPLRCMGVVT